MGTSTDKILVNVNSDNCKIMLDVSFAVGNQRDVWHGAAAERSLPGVLE